MVDRVANPSVDKKFGCRDRSSEAYPVWNACAYGFPPVISNRMFLPLVVKNTAMVESQKFIDLLTLISYCLVVFV
jgi:hypothetical protein